MARTLVVALRDLYKILLPQYGQRTRLLIISSEIFLLQEKQVYFTMLADLFLFWCLDFCHDLLDGWQGGYAGIGNERVCLSGECVHALGAVPDAF